MRDFPAWQPWLERYEDWAARRADYERTPQPLVKYDQGVVVAVLNEFGEWVRVTDDQSAERSKEADPARVLREAREEIEQAARQAGGQQPQQDRSQDRERER